MAAPVKRFAKRVVGYPEDGIPVISSKDWTRSFIKDPRAGIIAYLVSLFPFLQWITRYNLGWAAGDVIAGLTVGIVLVPQGMSYAVIATLPPEYGLYSSFVGVFCYVFFATSKDVSIGPVAVMSLTVAQIIRGINDSHPNVYAAPLIATTISFLCGFIVLGVGLLRLGWLVEFIPAPAVSGFMTGSAINIVTSQLPGLIGVSGFDTRAVVYKVIINTLKRLPQARLDAAFGITGLVSLYVIRYSLEALARKYPRRARLIFFVTVMRNGLVIVILTIAAYLYTRHRKDKAGNYPIRILKTVPRGFQHVGTPTLDPTLMKALLPQLPVATIILLLEHIAISKSFGRVNGYKINPNQELVAIGVTNTVGTLFNAYPATGSFSRSALSSKSGVRSPAAGWVTGLVVLVALYGLTSLFFWIPTAGLSAIIIHAVADLVASPKQVYGFWRVSPLEFIIWVATVAMTIFSSIENGIYMSIVASLVLLLVRVAKPRGSFLGRVKISTDVKQNMSRSVYVPLKINAGVMNPYVKVSLPKPGVVIYRFEESILYANCSELNDIIVQYVKENTRRGKDMSQIGAGDRPWNDPGPPPNGQDPSTDPNKPILKAVVLDFSSVSHVDTTGVQSLIDTRTELEKWADAPVEFHFANILSPWIRRALIAAKFGTAEHIMHAPHEIAPVVPSHGGYNDPDHEFATPMQESPYDLETAAVKKPSMATQDSDMSGPIVSASTPFFHFDLEAAVRAAETGVVEDIKHRSSFSPEDPPSGSSSERQSLS